MTEDLFHAVSSRNWMTALDLAHALRLSDDPLADRARSVLVEAVSKALDGPEAESGKAGLTNDALEKLLLLDRGGFLRLPEATLDRAAETLVARHRDHPGKAVRYARFRPESASCRAVLAQFGEEAAAEVHEQETGRVSLPRERYRPPGRRSIFRSRQERVLYQAAVRVFPGYLIVPNVALHAAVDYGAVSGRLNAAERGAFFRVLIDLVVFDPTHDFEPAYFFELDSPWHDDPGAASRDRLKERMIGLAGCPLVRLRPNGEAGLGEMTGLIRKGIEM